MEQYLKLRNNIKADIYRSEQWEWKAILRDEKDNIIFVGTGSNESNALLDLYENVFAHLNEYL